MGIPAVSTRERDASQYSPGFKAHNHLDQAFKAESEGHLSFVPNQEPQGQAQVLSFHRAKITMTVKAPGTVLRLPALFHLILATPTMRAFPLWSSLHSEETEAHRGKHLAQSHSTEPTAELRFEAGHLDIRVPSLDPNTRSPAAVDQ